MAAPHRPRFSTLRSALCLLFLVALVAGLCALATCRRQAGHRGKPDTEPESRRERLERDAARRRQERAARRSRRTTAEMQALQASLTAASASLAPQTAGRAFQQRRSPEQEELLNRAATRFRAALDDTARMVLLDELAEIPDPRVLEVVGLALSSSNPEIRRRALEVVGGYEVAAVIPLAQRGLADPDAAVRLAAVNALAAVNDAGTTPLLTGAIGDPTEAVRAAVFESLAVKPASVRLDLYQAGILSAYADVGEAVVSAITFAPSQDALYVLFDGLNSPSADLRQSVNAALYFLISTQFDTQAEAVRWWEANRDRFDAELREKE